MGITILAVCVILVWILSMFDAIILGFIQGVTEFLPVSSSGHLVIFRDLLSLNASNALAFDVMLHVATLGAVLIYFSKDLWLLAQAFLRLVGRLPVNQKDLILLKALVVATIPAGLVGYFSESLIEQYINTAAIVVFLLCIAAFFFIYAEWRYLNSHRQGALSVKTAWYIGLFQALALLPGFSRSGMTIVGGMLLGLTRYESARFSFLLAIPIIAGVGAKKFIDLLAVSADVDWGPLWVGTGVAFVVAILVIHFFLAFIRRYTLWPFIWYTFILAGLVGYYYFVG